VKARVCVADSASVLRAGVREVLLRERDFAVVEAYDARSLVAAVKTGVDIALIDEALPPYGATPAVRAISGRCAEIIVWSVEPDATRVLNAVRAGATGYLRKETKPAEFLQSLRSAAGGEAPLPGDLAALMIDALHAAERTAEARDLAAVLSAREQEVLGHVARDFQNKQIASALSISEFTVKRHVQNILRKLDLPSRRAAAAFYTSLVGTVAAEESAR
jgi:two-component system nitrate/nitrite response regulator NarL